MVLNLRLCCDPFHRSWNLLLDAHIQSALAELAPSSPHTPIAPYVTVPQDDLSPIVQRVFLIPDIFLFIKK